jgi:hypothetical protein
MHRRVEPAGSPVRLHRRALGRRAERESAVVLRRATLNGNDSETTRLRSGMDATALIGAVTFLRTAPAACAG